MATRKTTAPQQEPSQPTREQIKMLDMDSGLAGMVRLLGNYTGGPSTTGRGTERYGKLSDPELITLKNQANNLRTAAIEGLRLMADMAAAHSSEVGELNMNSFTWLMSHLVDTVEEMAEIDWETAASLSDRGYDFRGHPVAQAVQS